VTNLFSVASSSAAPAAIPVIRGSWQNHSQGRQAISGRWPARAAPELTPRPPGTQLGRAVIMERVAGRINTVQVTILGPLEVHDDGGASVAVVGARLRGCAA
jgi:hypothetical protein